MKKILFMAGLVELVFMSGCASVVPSRTLAPVGPDTPTTFATSSPGSLRVFSGYDSNFSAADEAQPFQNAAYEIRTESGVSVETVPNRYGVRVGDMPPAVPLAAGHYRVIAWSPRYGLVAVPVTIASGRVTTVHLETDQG